MRIFRQGDVVVREVKGLPEGYQRNERGEIRVTGETGQDHVMTDVKVTDINWNQYVTIPEEGAVMTHPEHPPLQLPGLMVARVERVRTIRGPSVD